MLKTAAVVAVVAVGYWALLPPSLRDHAPLPSVAVAPRGADFSGVWWDRADGGVVCRENAMTPADLIERVEQMGGRPEVVTRGPSDAPTWVFVAGGLWMHHFYRSGETCRNAALRAAAGTGS